MTASNAPFHIYGLTQSYFTRKLTAYLDYKRIPYLFRRSGGAVEGARAAGWSGGIPVVQTPEGDWMWDTTDMIHYLERRYPEHGVIPTDPTLRFLCYALEDVIDEWLYRPAVGSRWLYEENTRHGGFELAREVAFETPLPADAAFAAVKAHVTASCEPFGVTSENVAAWIDEVLKPWLRVVAAHLETSPYLLGSRPSLADFALFGGNAAHFTNDPLCRRWVDETGRAIVEHTRRLLEPEEHPAGDGQWIEVPSPSSLSDFAACSDPTRPPDASSGALRRVEASEVRAGSGPSAEGFGPQAGPAERTPAAGPSLFAVLADLRRLYLPWVSQAARDGSAELLFASGQRATICATPFLREARRVLLARYLDLRTDALDALLRSAGILQYYSDFVADAGDVPTHAAPPRPRLNRPFAPPWEQERP
jgi:glutathione S-transferase